MLYTIMATNLLFHKHSGEKYTAEEIEEKFNHDFNAFKVANVHKCECCGYYFIGDGVSNPELIDEQIERGNVFDLICHECFSAAESFRLDNIPFYTGIAFANDIEKSNNDKIEDLIINGGFESGN